MPKQESNRQRDKEAFIEKINSILIQEIPAVFDEGASSALLASLDKSKLLIMGEMHGVKENVDVIYTLFKKFGFRQLALEWESELKEIVEHYLETGEIDFGAIQDSPDGRITAGHFALLKKLKMRTYLNDLFVLTVQEKRIGMHVTKIWQKMY